MKKYILITLLCACSTSLLAQQTNATRGAFSNSERPRREREDFPRKGRNHEPSEEQKLEEHERRIQLMDEALDKIGVSKAEREKIILLQKEHREIMKVQMDRLKKARKKLSALQDASASETELNAAIDEVSDAQTDQLKTLVRNRMQMEQILGKEKFKLFMEKARQQFKKHGRHGGPDMPKQGERRGPPQH